MTKEDQTMTEDQVVAKDQVATLELRMVAERINGIVIVYHQEAVADMIQTLELDVKCSSIDKNEHRSENFYLHSYQLAMFEKLNINIFIRASLEKTLMHRCKQQKTGI